MSEESGDDKKRDREDIVKLSFRDYLALAVAALETFLLPLVIIGVVIAALALFFALRP